MFHLPRSWAWFPLVLALACAGTESSQPPVVSIIEPTGWIYFQDGRNEDDPIRRINVATGVIETLVPPPPLLPAKRFSLWPQMVSSQTGEVAASAPGGGFPATMIWNHATGGVIFHRDPSVTVDNFHRWSPDGRAVGFLRRSATILDGRSRVILLDPRTGGQDTVHVTQVGRTIKWFSWIGNDTLLLDVVEGGTELGLYDALRLSDGMVAPISEVPKNLGLPPLISPDQRWMVSTLQLDSVIGSADTIARFRQSSLRDRSTGIEVRLKLEVLFSLEGNIAFEFSPDSRFLASCPTDTLMIIHRLPTTEEVKRLHGIFCQSLSWSWGPEGPPPGR
ncbi:MAG: hypothetical protein SFU57_12115 [Gemmatimonadales bacterium]|nr:hypothetical protein [Gemmatimonadales bacterium]